MINPDVPSRASRGPFSGAAEAGSSAPVVAVLTVAGVARPAQGAGDRRQHANRPGVEEAAALVALARRRLRASQA